MEGPINCSTPFMSYNKKLTLLEKSKKQLVLSQLYEASKSVDNSTNEKLTIPLNMINPEIDYKSITLNSKNKIILKKISPYMDKVESIKKIGPTEQEVKVIVEDLNKLDLNQPIFSDILEDSELIHLVNFQSLTKEEQIKYLKKNNLNDHHYAGLVTLVLAGAVVAGAVVVLRSVEKNKICDDYELPTIYKDKFKISKPPFFWPNQAPTNFPTLNNEN